MWTFLKILSLYWFYYSAVSVLCFWFFALEACGILVPWPGIELVPPALEGKVLTTELQGSPFILTQSTQSSVVSGYQCFVINKGDILSKICILN